MINYNNYNCNISLYFKDNALIIITNDILNTI